MANSFTSRGKRVNSVDDVFRGITRQIALRTRSIENASAIALAENMKRLTPVDTGRARSHWSVARGNNHLEFNSGRTGDHPVFTQGLEGFGPISIANAVSYIDDLENGSSDQAPNGMTRLTIQAASVIISKAFSR